MSGRVRLARDRSLLCAIGFREAMLAKPHPGDQVQRFDLMQIEPARAAEFLCRPVRIACFRIKPAQGQGCAVIPPVVPGKIRDETKRRSGAFGLTEQLGFETNNFPDFRILGARLLQNDESYRDRDLRHDASGRD